MDEIYWIVYLQGPICYLTVKSFHRDWCFYTLTNYHGEIFPTGDRVSRNHSSAALYDAGGRASTATAPTCSPAPRRMTASAAHLTRSASPKDSPSWRRTRMMLAGTMNMITMITTMTRTTIRTWISLKLASHPLIHGKKIVQLWILIYLWVWFSTSVTPPSEFWFPLHLNF